MLVISEYLFLQVTFYFLALCLLHLSLSVVSIFFLPPSAYLSSLCHPGTLLSPVLQDFYEIPDNPPAYKYYFAHLSNARDCKYSSMESNLPPVIRNTATFFFQLWYSTFGAYKIDVMGQAHNKFSSFRIFGIQLIFDPKVRYFRLENISLTAQVIGKSSVFL